jgi:hypothetical protein
MRRRNALFAALLVAHELAATSSAQQPSIASLLSQSKWARFELMMGQITAYPLRCAQGRLSESTVSANAVEERLSFNGDMGLPCFRYDLQDPQQIIEIRVQNRTRISITRRPKETSKLKFISFQQGERGRVTLTVGQGDDQQTCSEHSLWHLLLNEPEISRRHLVPLLEMLRGDWELLAMVEEIEDSLHDTSQAATLSKRDVWQLVAQLDSPRFPVRQAADQRLRALGVSILPHLENLDRTRLSGEQRVRVRQLCEELRQATSDTPLRVVAWLGNDERFWRQWLSEPDSRRGQVAAECLATMYGRRLPRRDAASADPPEPRVASLPHANAPSRQ